MADVSKIVLSNGTTYDIKDATARAELEAIADYPVAYGTCGFWTYVMWASGRAECWGAAPETSTAITSAWGSWYESAAQFAYFPGGTGFPFSVTIDGSTVTKLFAAAPDVVLCQWENSSAGSNVGSKEIGAGRTALRTENIYLMRPTSATVKGRINWIAKGRWK